MSEVREITLELIRKRSEHNECLVSNLEEISLHQEELECIGSILGRTCGKTLKILLLQNNVISSLRPSEMRYFKSLEYLNLALNNLTTLRGLVDSAGGLENLQKLDLTLNFIALDALQESIRALGEDRCPALRELYLLGNPCHHNQHQSQPNGHRGSSTGWDGCRMYVVAKLPQLRVLDGTQILRSERITALQRLPELQLELHRLATQHRPHNHLKPKPHPPKEPQCTDAHNQTTEHTPEVRAQMSREMVQQREQKDLKERANQPRRRGEHEFQEEQEATIERARQREERGEIRQCNEGKWLFSFDEEQRPGHLLLDVAVQKHLSSSLIDVDIHPTYVSIVIKSKILRLVLPVEVHAEQSLAQRSTTTGHLLLIMPTVHSEKNTTFYCSRRKEKESTFTKGTDKEKLSDCKGTLANAMMEEGKQSHSKRTKPVRIDGLIKPSQGGMQQEIQSSIDMREVTTIFQRNDLNRDKERATHEVVTHAGNVECSQHENFDVRDDVDEPPPLC